MTDAMVMDRFQRLTETVSRLEQRIEDLEDLRDLEQAIADNRNTPLIPWEKAKADLGLD